MEDSILYITPQEEAFMIDKETKSLFKIQPLRYSLADVNRLRNFSFAFEQKLSNAFSISPIVNIDFNNNIAGESNRVGLGMEVRYYYKLPKLIKEQKQANNLSSNYFAASFLTNYSTGSNWSKNYDNINLSYGIQKRFLNYGYLDFKVNLGVNRVILNRPNINPSQGSSFNHLYLSTGTNVGIGLGKKYELSEEAKCPIFRCFSNRRSAFKINLNKTWSLSRHLRDTKQTTLFLNPNIIHEVKIGKSPVSFEQDLDAWIYFSDRRFNNDGTYNNRFGLSSYRLKYRMGFKYYYSLKSRIRNGKSGNNLSGHYIFGRGEFTLGQTPTFELLENGLWITKKLNYRGQGVQLGAGYQKEVLENLFFDINLGVSRGVGKHKNFQNNFEVISDIKVGIMF